MHVDGERVERDDELPPISPVRARTACRSSGGNFAARSGDFENAFDQAADILRELLEEEVECSELTMGVLGADGEIPRLSPGSGPRRSGLIFMW